MNRSVKAVSVNNTVKLPPMLRQRVEQAMAVEGFTVWSEFCRVALTEKCQHVEDRLRTRDPAGFQRRYQGHGAQMPGRS